MKNKGLASEFERNDQDSKHQHLPDSTTQLHSELPRGYNEAGLNRIGELLKTNALEPDLTMRIYNNVSVPRSRRLDDMDLRITSASP